MDVAHDSELPQTSMRRQVVKVLYVLVISLVSQLHIACCLSIETVENTQSTYQLPLTTFMKFLKIFNKSTENKPGRSPGKGSSYFNGVCTRLLQAVLVLSITFDFTDTKPVLLHPETKKKLCSKPTTSSRAILISSTTTLGLLSPKFFWPIGINSLWAWSDRMVHRPITDPSELLENF
ncbi:hypothetical protein YC2023_001593 [Brassica napus]